MINPVLFYPTHQQIWPCARHPDGEISSLEVRGRLRVLLEGMASAVRR
jgi:hypothetical protein